MALLAVDIGNTNLTFGLFDDERLVGSWRVATRPEATEDEAALLVDGGLRLLSREPRDVDAMAVVSVVPPLTDRYLLFARDRARIEPLLLDAASLGRLVRVEVERPAEVGADRLVNALAVHAERGGPAIVVDVGTATTFDVVDAGGAYVGGAIAPGPGIALEALVRAASKLPRVELKRPPRAIGVDTVSAMQSGMVNGYVGLVSGLLTAIRAELAERSPAGARINVVATGGYAGAPWLRDLPGIDAVEPDLTLRGVWLAHARLRSPTPTGSR